MGSTHPTLPAELRHVRCGLQPVCQWEVRHVSPEPVSRDSRNERQRAWLEASRRTDSGPKICGVIAKHRRGEAPSGAVDSARSPPYLSLNRCPRSCQGGRGSAKPWSKFDHLRGERTDRARVLRGIRALPRPRRELGGTRLGTGFARQKRPASTEKAVGPLRQVLKGHNAQDNTTPAVGQNSRRQVSGRSRGGE
jgi:hypothetical protein